MRHQKAGKKFNRTGSHRDAMFRNMVTSLFIYGKIRTTDAKAKELRRWADRMITLAKRGDLHARRQALAVMRSKDVVHKLFEEASERFGQRAGGYTRIVKLGTRSGDGALLSLIEFVGSDEKKEKKKKRKSAKKTVAKKEAPVKAEEKKVEAAAAEEEAEKAEAVEKPKDEEIPEAEASAETPEAQEIQDVVPEPEDGGDAEAPEAEVKEEIAASADTEEEKKK